MALDSMQEIFDKIQAGRKPFWQVVRDTDVEERQVTAEASFEKMHATWRAMVESVDTYRADRRSVSGLVGGDAQRMWDYAAQQETLCGPYLQEVIATALCVAESNACMHRIVAAPTAGSAGVVPGMMLALQECYRISDQRIVDALFNAGAVGYLAMRNATVAGAVGGCQAEIGIASAMAASAAVELMGGTPEQCLDAASTVLMNMLGLVCDPVGGLVEYPCQNRNAAGVANALIAAEISLSGIRQLIPFDQMLDAMYAVGKRLPAELRETALGGCATTPAACAACGLCS